MRKTPLLNSVVSLLSKGKRHFSVPEMQQLLAKKNITPNKTTLYRMLEKLSKSEQIEAFTLDSKVTYYELKIQQHHHHFRCQHCKEIQCITDPTLENYIHVLEKKLQTRGLVVQGHHFSLNGKCAACV